jgi:hypothetical protein
MNRKVTFSMDEIKRLGVIQQVKNIQMIGKETPAHKTRVPG